MTTVLVTGGSGFVGSHCILQLLAKGHEVRTTVRHLDREKDVRIMLKQGGAAEPGLRLKFFAADLEKDAGWSDAVKGCDYVLHVASPFSTGVPLHEDELIRPAREGALRVLRAARDSGVKRVVLTSSFAAIGYGHPPTREPFDETTWTNTGSHLAPYIKSKALAERAAWDFIKNEGGMLELTVINPVGIFGPVLGHDYASSIRIIQSLLEGAMRACPKIYFGVVDVRDVAELHLRAMTSPAAKGQRFLASSADCVSMHEIAMVLKRRLGVAAEKVPDKELSSWLIRVSAFWNPQAKQMVSDLDKIRHHTNAKARRVFEWTPRTMEEAIVATAESLLSLGLIGTN